jgi:hypothetical protein
MTFKHKLSVRLARMRRTGAIVAIGLLSCTDNPLSSPETQLPTISALTTNILAGSKVKTTGTANVRSGPSGSAPQVGTQPIGALGTVLGGPIVDSTGDKLTRYNVDFDAGVDGWVAQEYAGLALVSSPASASSVAVSPKPAAVYTGKTLQLSAVAKDSAGNTLTSAPMTWLSRDTLKMKVNASGLVTGVAIGTAYVLATSGTKMDSTPVTVSQVAVASVAVSPASASLTVAGTAQLTATTKDSAGNTLTGRAIAWSSSNALVASVSSSGLVSGLAAGSATITATSEGKSGSAAVTVTVATIVHKGWYVSASGSSGNSGSSTSPWNLSYALGGAGGKVQPGDTVWVRGGTYYAPFRSTLTGTATARIVVRAYPGERAIIDGANTTSDNFVVAGSYSIIWGLEFTNTNPSRYTADATSHSYRADDIINSGPHNKYVNLIVHDGGVAFYTYSAYPDLEIYGGIFYDNGWQSTDRGHGHALYLKNDVGPVVAKDNVIFNQYGYGIHVYTNTGDGLLNNIWLEGNVSFDNGSLSSTGTSANLGNLGQPLANNLGVVNNMTYFAPSLSGSNLSLGSGSGLTATGNYVVGGGGISQGSWTGAAISGNTVLAAGSASRPAAVFVRPNLYEPGRATIIVYNWSGQGSVTADLSAVLPVGASYDVRNVQNLFGAPVVSGTYGGGSIVLPMSGVTPPVPVGLSSSSAPKTGPYFDVFIVTKR